MKKTLSLLLTVALLLSGLALLSACVGHQCSFSTDWSHDDTNHWHACEKKDCLEVADQAAHNWDDGEITTKPTQEAVGVKTYTCSVCSHTKTEDVAFTGMTKEEWNAVIHPSTFDNYTLTMTIVGSGNGVEVTSTLVYKFADDKIYFSMTAGGQTSEQILDENVAEEKQEMAAELVAMFNYDDFTYDAEAKLYRAKSEIEVVIDDSKPTDATLRFEDGKLAEMKYSYVEETNTTDVNIVTTIVFSDYGTTVVSDAK